MSKFFIICHDVVEESIGGCHNFALLCTFPKNRRLVRIIRHVTFAGESTVEEMIMTLKISDETGNIFLSNERSIVPFYHMDRERFASMVENNILRRID